MRREQIHKICLNHLLTPDIEYKVKDTKSWQFIANDFSDGKIESDLFCLRFKTEEIANEFKTAIDDILNNKIPKMNGNDNGNDHTKTISSNATPEESQNITKLQLPGDFYEFNNKETCTGCRGCESDDFVFSESKDTNFPQIDNNPLPLIPPPKVETLHNDLSKNTKKSGDSNPFSFGSSFKTEGNGFSFSNESKTNNTEQSGMLFGSSSFKSVFASGGNETKDLNKSNSVTQPNMFGGNVAKTDSADSVKTLPSFSFNNSSLFGTSGM